MTMTALQLIESLATNPSYKVDTLKDNSPKSDIAIRAEQEIADLLDKQGKYWCALFPEKDDEKEQESETPDDDEEKTTTEN